MDTVDAPRAQERVFISHAEEDDEAAQRIQTDIRAVGGDTWRFDDDAHGPGTMFEQIGEGMNLCSRFVILITPEAMDSRSVRMELGMALMLYVRKRIKSIVPVLLRPVQDHQIPTVLAAFRYYDATKNYDRARDGMLVALGLSARRDTVPPAAPQDWSTSDLTSPLPALVDMESIASFSALPTIPRQVLYVLVDISASMAKGRKIDLINATVTKIYELALSYAPATCDLHISVILFADQASQFPIVPVRDYSPLKLQAGGTCSLGGALWVLNESLERDIEVASGAPELSPVVFLLTDGHATDRWEQEAKRFRSSSRARHVIGCAISRDANVRTLKAICPRVISLDDIDARLIREVLA